MATSQRETEDKYDVDAAAVLPPLDALPGVASVEVSEPFTLASTYYDTDDLALARVGITLRRRTGGHDEGWHLKLPAGGSRQEVQLPLSRAVRTVPKELRDTVRAVTRDRTLAPVVELRNRRTEHRLLDAEGTLLATVADDLVETDQAAWREWEVELGSGGRTLLRDAGRLLAGAGARPARTGSKLARALGDRLPRPAVPPPVAPDATAGDLVQARLAEQVHRLRLLDPLVRRDVPDAVHRMRVTARRLRSTLATFRPVLDRTVTDPVRSELRWLGRALGDARDTEVLHARLTELVTGQDSKAAARVVEAELTGRERQAREQVLAALSSDRYLSLLDRLDDLAAAPPLKDKASAAARTVARTRVRHDWRRVADRVEAATRSEDAAERAGHLHEARKAAKRLRYAGETAAPVVGKPARRTAKDAKRLQSALGDHHDAVVTQTTLRELADSGEAAFTFGVLHAYQERAAQEAERQFRRSWRKASGKKRRRWFHG